MRKLKGTVTQALPGWNIKQMAGSSTGTIVNFGDIHAIGLLNTAAAGEWLVVWDVQVYAYPAGDVVHITVVDFAIMRGRTGSGLFSDQPNFPLASAVGTLPGLVWQDIPGSEQGAIFHSVALPQQGYQWPHEWPICAIQPGDSCVVYSDGNAANHFGVAYIYEVVPGGL